MWSSLQAPDANSERLYSRTSGGTQVRGGTEAEFSEGRVKQAPGPPIGVGPMRRDAPTHIHADRKEASYRTGDSGLHSHPEVSRWIPRKFWSNELVR